MTIKTFLNGLDSSIPKGSRNLAEGEGCIDPTADENVRGDTAVQRLVSGLKVWADVGVDLGRQVASANETNRRLLRRLENRTPIKYQHSKSGTVDSNGDPLVLSLGKPQEGAFWQVESVIVGGTELNLAAAGEAGLYVTGFIPSLVGQTPGTNYAVDYAGGLPNPGFYGGRKVYAVAGEYVVVVIFGGTPGQVYVANMTATVFNVAAGAGRDVNTI